MDTSIDQLSLILIIVTVNRVAASDRCQFPDFLQSNRTLDRAERQWMSHVVNNEEGSSLCAFPVSFDGGNWHQKSPGRDCHNVHIDDDNQVAFKRECILAVQRNRFVVRHYDVKMNIDLNITMTYRRNLLFKGYLCVEFVRRGQAVAQIRTTEKYRWLADSSVCNDDVILDEWPLVDIGEAYFSAPSSCRIAIGRGNHGEGGGFSVRLYDKVLRRGVCDALHGETRVEFACSADDIGIDDSDNLIEFRFRHHACVPRGIGMAINQRVNCLASWTDDSSGNGTAQQSFAVLRHDVDKRVWCFRFPSSIPWSEAGSYQRSSSFTAHLFRDLRCDRAGQTELKTDRYLRIDFIMDAPIYDSRLEQRTSSPEMATDEDNADDNRVDRRNAEAESVIDGRLLCRDDYEACQFWANQPCREAASAERLACPRRCRVCSDDRPTSCSLPHDLRGHWKKDGHESLIIGRRTLQVEFTIRVSVVIGNVHNSAKKPLHA